MSLKITCQPFRVRLTSVLSIDDPGPVAALSAAAQGLHLSAAVPRALEVQLDQLVGDLGREAPAPGGYGTQRESGSPHDL